MRPLQLSLATLLTMSASAISQQAMVASGIVPAKVTVLGEIRDSVCSEVAPSPVDRNLLACTSREDLRVYDLAKHTSTTLIPNMYAGDIAWSRAGNRLAFYWDGEDGTKQQHVWTLDVDPRSGRRTGEPRRVSVSEGSDPSFSPDGNEIAFGTRRKDANRKIAVVPSMGGAERVLAEGDVNCPCDWTPDGKWIFYRQSSANGNQRGPGVYRVPSSGGAAELVTPLEKYYHGLSGDGRHLLASPDSNVGDLSIVTILNAKGEVLGKASASHDLHNGTGTGNDWSAQSLHLFMNQTLRPQTLRAVTIATGASRNILSQADRPRAAWWSRDGRQFVVQVWSGGRYDLAVMSADGGNRRYLHTSAEPTEGGVVDSWSPDGRYLAYVSPDRALHVIEIATGRDTRLAQAELAIPICRWASDSRSILFVAHDGAGPQPHLSFNAVDLHGQRRVVRDLGTRQPPGFLFLSDTSVLAVADGTVLPFGPGEPRRLHGPTTIRPKPGVSADGRWVAFMPNGLGGTERPGAYEIVSTDGRSSLSVTLPGGMQSTAPLFSADNRFLIVPSVAVEPTGAVSTPEQARIAIVPVNGDPPRTLVTLPKGEGVINLVRRADQYFGGALSPDGKTLLYVAQARPIQSYLDVDLSGAVGVTQSGNARKQP